MRWNWNRYYAHVKICLEKSRSPNGNQGTHEIPATSQFMVRQAKHWAMGYGDVCLSSPWASNNVNRTRLLFSHLRHNISSFRERLLMVSYWHRTLASTLNTDQRNTLHYKHLASTLNKYCVQIEPTSCYNYILFVKGNNLLNIKDC